MSVKVLIATTKAYEMPEDGFHLPVQVGALGHESIGYQRDDEGENISDKNPYYCELTGIYWAWKNLNQKPAAKDGSQPAAKDISQYVAQDVSQPAIWDGSQPATQENDSQPAAEDSDIKYLGLEHYRRRLKLDKYAGAFETGEQIPDIILPRRRNYYIESLYSHYAHTHYAEHLDIAREIIEEKYPEYADAVRTVYRATGGFMFNMFVMRWDLFDEYCSWIFDILGELEKKIDISQYDAFQARLYGRVSEILFNVWLTKKLQSVESTDLTIKTVPVIYLEKQHIFKKVTNLLKSKFGKKKYEKSL